MKKSSAYFASSVGGCEVAGRLVVGCAVWIAWLLRVESLSVGGVGLTGSCEYLHERSLVYIMKKITLIGWSPVAPRVVYGSMDLRGC